MTKRRPSNPGLSLIEMLTVMTLVGILTLLMAPRIDLSFTQANVRSAQGAIITKYQRTKSVAVQGNRIATLNLAGNLAWITASPRLTPHAGSAVDTVEAVTDFGALYGVTLTATPTGTLGVDPRGIGTSGATITFARAGLTDSVIISTFGRITK